MQFFPADMYQYLQMVPGMGIPLSSGTGGYSDWMQAQQDYATRTGTAGLTSTNFYLVLAFPQGDFANKIDMHPDLPMMVPASGITPPILGVYSDEAAATVAMDKDDERVHLIYKLRLRGHMGITEFLEFMATHDMMEKVGGR